MSGSRDLRRRFEFGAVALDAPRLALRHRLDEVLVAECRALPGPLPEDALGILRGYTRAGAGDPDFFKLFYSPLWSWLHWVPQGASWTAREQALAEAGQAMAMFLHLWDDHLSDGQIRTNPLALQLRTRAWVRFESAARSLAEGVPGGEEVVRAELDRYFTAIYRPREASTIDTYCARFADQMATWVLVPRLSAALISGPEAAADLHRVLDALGAAWRLLDDLKDIAFDIVSGEETIVHNVLDAEGRAAWAACRSEIRDPAEPEGPAWEALLARLERESVIAALLSRIARELADGAAVAEARGWRGLAAELLAMREPLAAGR